MLHLLHAFPVQQLSNFLTACRALCQVAAAHLALDEPAGSHPRYVILVDNQASQIDGFEARAEAWDPSRVIETETIQTPEQVLERKVRYLKRKLEAADGEEASTTSSGEEATDTEEEEADE